MSSSTNQPLPALDKVLEISHILYREARYLDENQYMEWLSMLDPEIHYRIPARRNHYIREKSGHFTHPIDTDHYDDNFESLSYRVERLQRPGSSSLDPRPREVRQISNIEVYPAEVEGLWQVYSTITLFRNRLLDLDESIAARRTDEWRESESAASYKLVNRTVWITQNSILMANMASLL